MCLGKLDGLRLRIRLRLGLGLGECREKCVTLSGWGEGDGVFAVGGQWDDSVAVHDDLVCDAFAGFDVGLTIADGHGKRSDDAVA